MLHQMAEDYEVDPVYVLDMYHTARSTGCWTLRSALASLFSCWWLARLLSGESKRLFGAKRKMPLIAISGASFALSKVLIADNCWVRCCEPDII